MSKHDRRKILRGTVLAAAGLAGGQLVPPAVAVADESGNACAPPLGPATVLRGDRRYEDLVRRGHKRFVASPDYIRVVGSTQQVVQALDEAVKAGKRVVVRGGGHCLENFVDDPAVKVIIDLSGMTGVYFDPAMNAFAIEGGALLNEVYRRLFLGWGVTVPAGWCPRVGVGGHISGGGYGVLSRTFGLVVDHLYAVEVVVVDQTGKSRVVVATRDPSDPNHDLWWANTGGGGGNFGIVTKYWMRTPGATGAPENLLPKPPAAVLDFSAEWPWEGMDQAKFSRLIRNHGEWCERNAAPGSPNAPLYAEMIFYRPSFGKQQVIGQVFGPDGDKLLDDYLHEVSEGVGAPAQVVRNWGPWLATAMNGPDQSKPFRFKVKSAYLRKRFTDEQAATIYQQLTAPHEGDLLIGSVGLSTYGGQINAMASDATATATRDAIIKLTYVAAWQDPTQDAIHDEWIRKFYKAVYARTGGVPDPRDGAYISYPDRDLADPAQNTSGIPWSTLYYKGNYPRLQRIKSRYDPRDVFRHALAIRPA